jgi:hypothetical protein
LEAKQQAWDSSKRVGEARLKIDDEMIVKEHRLKKEAELRAKYPTHFDQTKDVDLGK